jgi:hypothetical protein
MLQAVQVIRPARPARSWQSGGDAPVRFSEHPTETFHQRIAPAASLSTHGGQHAELLLLLPISMGTVLATSCQTFGSVPSLDALIQLAKLLFGPDRRFAAASTDSFSVSTNFTASARNSGVYIPFGIRSISAPRFCHLTSHSTPLISA